MDKKIPKISSLQGVQNERVESLNNIYKTVLNRAVEKILEASKHTDKSFVIFKVPQLMIGHLNYSIRECVYYITTQLTKSGYLVNYIEPCFMYIDWGTEKTSLKIEAKKTQIMKHFPNATNIEYVYK